jgi:hypothetical protein
MTTPISSAGHDFCGGWHEITEALYWYFLEVLPPYYGPERSMFAVGEAQRGDPETGEFTYTICVQRGERYYATENTLSRMNKRQLPEIK